MANARRLLSFVVAASRISNHQRVFPVLCLSSLARPLAVPRTSDVKRSLDMCHAVCWADYVFN